MQLPTSVSGLINSGTSAITSATGALNNITSSAQSAASSLLSLSGNTSNTGSAASSAVTSAINVDKVSFSPVANVLTQTDAQINNAISALNTTPQLSTFGKPVSAIPNVLASPTFVTGAKDKLAAVDVYGVSKSTPINSITSLPTQLNIGTLTGLVGNKTGLTDINAAIGNASKAVADLNKANPITRLTNTSSAVAASLRTLPPGCSNNLLNNILSKIDKNSIVRTTINGITKAINKAHIPCITGMGGLVNSLSGTASSFKLTDPAASIASLSGVIKSASDIGMPNVFGPIMSAVTDKGIINQVAAGSLPSVISNSDLGSLSSMSSMTSPGSLILTNPNLIQDFSGSYVKSQGTSGLASDAVDYNSLMGSYKAIDPAWDTTARIAANGSSEDILNLSAITGASSDYNSTLRNGIIDNGDTANQNLLLAATLPKTDVNSEISNSFPGIALSSSLPPISPVAVDPITLNNQIASDVAAVNNATNSGTGPIIVNALPSSKKFTTSKDVHPDGSWTVTMVINNATTGEVSTVVKNYDAAGNQI